MSFADYAVGFGSTVKRGLGGIDAGIVDGNAQTLFGNRTVQPFRAEIGGQRAGNMAVAIIRSSVCFISISLM